MSISFFLSCVTLSELFSSLKPLSPDVIGMYIYLSCSVVVKTTLGNPRKISLGTFMYQGPLDPRHETQIIATSRPTSCWMTWVCWMAWDGETLPSTVVVPDEKQSKFHHLIDRRCSSFLLSSVW